MYFSFSPLKKHVALRLKSLNLLLIGLICIKCVSYWASGAWEEDAFTTTTSFDKLSSITHSAQGSKDKLKRKIGEKKAQPRSPVLTNFVFQSARYNIYIKRLYIRRQVSVLRPLLFLFRLDKTATFEVMNQEIVTINIKYTFSFVTSSIHYFMAKSLVSVLSWNIKKKF
jgi:hypothetical protein